MNLAIFFFNTNTYLKIANMEIVENDDDNDVSDFDHDNGVSKIWIFLL